MFNETVFGKSLLTSFKWQIMNLPLSKINLFYVTHVTLCFRSVLLVIIRLRKFDKASEACYVVKMSGTMLTMLEIIVFERKFLLYS